jgi:hypothetical protein
VSEEKQDTEQSVNLSEDDLEAALRLLSDEERLGKTERSALRTLFVFIVSLAIMVFACPAGVLTVWFERGLGIGLLIASAVAVVVFFAIIAGGSNPLEALEVVEQSAKDSKTGQAIAARIKPSQVGGVSSLLGCVGGVVMLLFFPGVAWLLFDLFTIRKINLFSLILIAAPVAFMFLLGYYQMRRDCLHYSRVSRLRSLLESQAQKPGETTVSSEEAAFLGRVESQQMVREIKQAAPEISKRLAESYAIETVPKARDYIRRLSAEQGEAALAVRQAIDALESNPRPPNAQQVPGSVDLLAIRKESSEIVYLVDDETRNISIVDVRGLGEEVKDAS